MRSFERPYVVLSGVCSSASRGARRAAMAAARRPPRQPGQEAFLGSFQVALGRSLVIPLSSQLPAWGSGLLLAGPPALQRPAEPKCLRISPAGRPGSAGRGSLCLPFLPPALFCPATRVLCMKCFRLVVVTVVKVLGNLGVCCTILGLFLRYRSFPG